MMFIGTAIIAIAVVWFMIISRGFRWFALIAVGGIVASSST